MTYLALELVYKEPDVLEPSFRVLNLLVQRNDFIFYNGSFNFSLDDQHENESTLFLRAF